MKNIRLPQASEREGNSETSLSNKNKQISRKTYYCFTYFYTNSDDILNLENRLKSICKKYYFGKEICPNTKNTHLQGFFTLKKPMRITELKDLRCHLEPSLGSQDQNENYCSKDGIITKYGYPKPIKIIENLYKWQSDICNLILNNEPDGRTINWYWESTGGKGKSSFCKYMFVKHNIITIQGGKCPDIMNIMFNLDCNDLTAIFIDLPRNSGNNYSEKAVECILNGMITNTKFETGVKVFNPPHVVIFANSPPIIEDMSTDRWNIVEII